MTRWPARDRRARVSAVVAEWFSPQRWSLNEQIIAVAAAVLAVSVFLPWYRAVVRIRNSDLTGFLIHPKGTASGITVHEYLWAIFGLALMQFVVVVARHAPGRNQPLTIPGFRPLVLVTSAISFAVALIAFVLKPSTWYGGPPVQGGGELYLTIGWDYGAVAALIATLALLTVSWTMLRDPVAAL